MAIDQWLFEQCHTGGHPPTLRFYTWSPSAISLGHHQQQWPSHWQGLRWQDRPLDLVRRPTGGRAVLHAEDLTYSIVLPHQSGHRRQTYEHICGFLIQGFKALGLDLQLGAAGRTNQRQVNCFASATAADLIGPNGAKLIGSAQVWRGQTVLQHGSIQLKPNSVLQSQVFGTKAITCPLASSLAIAQTIDALFNAAEAYFGITFAPQPLTTEEWEAIRVYIKGTAVESVEIASGAEVSGRES
jgi:lipoate---protein ligase